MKEEVMKVLSLLETGVINSQEAERLIRVINGKPKKVSHKTGENISDTFNKVGDSLGSFAKAVGEKAEKVANDAKPIIEKVGKKAGEAAENLAEKAKNIDLKKKNGKWDYEGECTEKEVDDENDFVKDDSVIIMPTEQAFSSKDGEQAEENKEEPEQDKAEEVKEEQ